MTSPDSTPERAPDAINPPKLLDQVRARIRARHYSIRTENQYVFWIRRFIVFHHKRNKVGVPLKQGRGQQREEGVRF